ncbi:MAG: carboxypeptidase-like regulatory domain-containing protein [Planctomycetaceae bacterium]|jgi:hypothetical protein|nr:carboxypeptidase-like regulatory domain-containing protein [Planctomycetaceae bacterium]
MPLNADGVFRFDDLPAGDYVLVISEIANCGMCCTEGKRHFQGEFTINDQNENIQELGKLTLVNQ